MPKTESDWADIIPSLAGLNSGSLHNTRATLESLVINFLADKQAVDRVFPGTTPEQRAAHSNPFSQWLDTPAGIGPMDAESEHYWQNQFRHAGLHHIDLVGRLENSRGPNDTLVTVGIVETLTMERQRKLEPPVHLYRAATAEFADRWGWFDTFEMAKLLADDRPEGLRIWTCDVEEAFASITLTRTEAGGYKHTWTEWIVKPKNVREINRWRDPFTEVDNLESWERRGAHAVEAASVVGGWFRSTDSKTAPMDRDQGEYWLKQFQDIGEFEAFSTWDANDRKSKPVMRVEPASEMKAPKLLYRGAPEERKARWSWSAEPETAQTFIDLFCPDDGKIWVAEVETVFGLINVEIQNAQPPFHENFSEWIVKPKEDTIREWTGQ